MKILFATLTRHDEPLGIMYLSTVLKNNGHDVCGVMLEKEDTSKVIDEFKPDVVGYSAMSCEKNTILHLNSKLKEKQDFFSIIGGPLPTFSPEIIDNKDVDAVCIGEGEEAMLEFVNTLEKGGDVSKIQNFWVKFDGVVQKNGLRSFLDIDSIPFPDREIFKKFKTDKVYNITTARGCPFNCTYCYNKQYKAMYEGRGPVVRNRSVDNLVGELKLLSEQFDLPIFAFQDDHFYSRLNLLKEFARKYKAQVGRPFMCSLRPEILTNVEVIKTLKDANCELVFTGCETGNDEIRKNILNRDISKEQTTTAADLLHKHGIKLIMQNMIGIPGSNFENDIETLELNIRCKPHYAWASICTPYPGTELFDTANKLGLIHDGYLNELFESYHLQTSLKLPHEHKINVLHKIFALVVEYPALLPTVKQPTFYEQWDKDSIKKLKAIFDSFKSFKYGQLHDYNLQKPKDVMDFVEQLSVPT